MKKIIPFALTLAPLFAFAATFNDIIETVMDILNVVVPLLIAVAVVIFLWGVVKYISAAGDEEKRKSGRDTMMWGIVGLFVMVAVWGLVNILVSTFGLETTVPDVPGLPTP